MASEAYYAKNTLTGYAASIAVLVPTYLKEAPPDGSKQGDKYKITYTPGASGAAPTIAGAVLPGGASCTA